MKNDPRPTCHTCPFFAEQDNSHGPQCRKVPPVVVRVQDRVNLSVWPDPTDQGRNKAPWCGEHPDFPGWLALQKGAEV